MGTPGHPALEREVEEFAKRYFLWALRDADREVKADFPYLRLLPARGTRAALDFIASLSNDERLTLVRAKVKKFHPICSSLGYEITRNEEVMIRYLSEYSRSQIREARGWYSQVPGRVNRKNFASILTRVLGGSAIGEYDPWDLPNGWRYKLERGPFTIYTHMDLGGKNRQLMYAHAIHLRSMPLYEWISLTAWLGFGTANFDLVTDSTLNEATETLKKCAAHFIAAIDGLLPTTQP